MPKYDRIAATTYAHKYWTRVCSDGFVATENLPVGDKTPLKAKVPLYVEVPLETVFERTGTQNREIAVLPDKNIIPWTNLEDCTHFISCAIGRPPGKDKGGGLQLGGQGLGVPGKSPYGFVSAPKLVEHLLSVGFAKLLTAPSPTEAPLAELTHGDVIAYFEGPKKGAGHLGLYLGEGKIACHTECRVDHKWNDIDGMKHYKFLHITA